MFRDQIRNRITNALGQLQEAGALPAFAVPAFSVHTPEDPRHGDYATNAALLAAHLLGRPPRELAERVAKEIQSRAPDVFDSVSAAGPGFINMRIANSKLIEPLVALLGAPDQWGTGRVGEGKTVRVEYFQLNIAKRPHIGHLRSAVIGDALKRMLLAQGYRAVSDTHVGDWGTQFGMLLRAYKERGGLPQGGDPFDALEEIYIQENAATAAEPSRRERAKAEFAKLEAGDPENRKIWQWMVDVSMQKLEASASRLGLLPFDMHYGESFYEDKMQPIVAAALAKGIAKTAGDGAIIVDLAAEGLDEAVLVKSDGASTYLLRDLATIKYAKETLMFAENLYVVDVRQSHHFRQLFRVAELLGLEGVGESEHVEFGFMSLPEGAMSTRKGTAIGLDLLLDEAARRARAVIRAKNPDLADADGVASLVGLGALKYFDLSHHRRSDIVFRWEEALAFEGNTGPYLQYTHARLKSILRKASQSGSGQSAGDAKIPSGANVDELEHRLLVSVLQLPEAVADGLVDDTPHTLANYLYHLAKLANEFYHSHPVMQEADGTKRALRLSLVAATAATLRNGLDLLGIAAPEEM